MRYFIFALIGLLALEPLNATVLHVGVGRQYANPALAARVAMPGDTILIASGQYTGTFWIENVRGTKRDSIVIIGESRTATIFQGGSESMHLSDCSYIILENFTLRGQTANGMNIDDAGTIETPAVHITIRNVTFSDMAATGNNDLLKLSGLDSFQITNCVFERGSAGGSGIDMVGCHHGLIANNSFQTLGSNAIQAKGGTQHIQILRNHFTDCGQRAVNLGGSTGLQFFRPLDAPFEAADLQVYANVFTGSLAPVAYVGCTRVDVANNTIVEPERWIFRVLQETVDASRFVACGNNQFRNNLIVYRSTIAAHVNVGTNTAPETFTLSNNLWYNASTPAMSAPNLGSITETASVYGSNPLLVDLRTDQHLQAGSPAIGKGMAIAELTHDKEGIPYLEPRSIGAYQWRDGSTGVDDKLRASSYHIERRTDGLYVHTDIDITLSWFDIGGRYIGETKHSLGTSHVAMPLTAVAIVTR